ncbi:MAG: tetratricopeptide repeat protein [Pseudomonadota bacterium]
MHYKNRIQLSIAMRNADSRAHRAGVALLMLCACGLGHAAATLKGVVLLNQLGGQPEANVQVAADGANPTVSDSTGGFLLAFPNRKPGESVRLRVVRKGWVVVNDIQLERELPDNPNRRPLEILISKAAEREQWALQFYRLKGREVAEAIYKRKLQELEKDRVSTVQERDRLRKERDQALAQADELAKELASVKTTERSDTYQRATRLFLDGQLDDALALLSEERLRREAEGAKQALEQAMRSYLLRGQLLGLKFQFEEAAKTYDEATKLAPQSFEAWFAYGYFHQQLNHFNRAGKGYQEALRIARGQANQPDIAKTLNNFGNLHSVQNRYDEARKAYEEALDIERDLARANPDTYRPDVAQTLNNLGNLHSTQSRHDAARSAFDEALAMYRDLADVHPDTYRPYVAGTLNNLGVLHSDQKRYDAARKADEEALVMYRDLALVNPDTYRPDVAMMLNNIGILHWKQKRYDAARKAYEEALAIRRDLALVNPDTYRPDVATTLNNLGVLHSVQNRYEEAHKAYEEALAIRRDIALINPDKYRPAVATTLSNFGNLHSDQKRYDAAHKAYEEALGIYEQFATMNPDRFAPDVERVRRLIATLPK